MEFKKEPIMKDKKEETLIFMGEEVEKSVMCGIYRIPIPFKVKIKILRFRDVSL